MKTLNSKLMVLMIVTSILGVGCGKSKSVDTSSANGIYTVSPTATTTTGGSSGTVPTSPTGSGTTTTPSSPNSVEFSPISFEEFSNYVASHPLNNPTNYKITVDLSDAGSGRYAGTVKISYVDNGYKYEGTFSAGSGNNQDLTGLKDNGMMEAEYNHWFVLNGKYYFTAYFQDAYGAIVLVFDSYVNQGDAQGTGVVSGSVYYKNFAQSYVQQSPYRKCWYIYSGPYDCRASAVMNKSAVYPGDGFKKLGTFSGLSKAAVMK